MVFKYDVDYGHDIMKPQTPECSGKQCPENAPNIVLGRTFAFILREHKSSNNVRLASFIRVNLVRFLCCKRSERKTWDVVKHSFTSNLLESIHIGVYCCSSFLFQNIVAATFASFDIFQKKSFVSVFDQAVRKQWTSGCKSLRNIRGRTNISTASSWRVSSSLDWKVAVLFEAPLICTVFSLQELFVVSFGARLYLNPLESHYGEDLKDVQVMRSKFRALKQHAKVSASQIKLPVGRLYCCLHKKIITRLTKFGIGRAQGKFIRKYLLLKNKQMTKITVVMHSESLEHTRSCSTMSSESYRCHADLKKAGGVNVSQESKLNPRVKCLKDALCSRSEDIVNKAPGKGIWLHVKHFWIFTEGKNVGLRL